MKEKKTFLDYVIFLLNAIPIAALITILAVPETKLGNIAGWVFLFTGEIPLCSYFEKYDNGGLKDKSDFYGSAIHLFCLFATAILFKRAREPFAAYIFGVLFLSVICLNKYNKEKYAEYKSRCEAMKAKEEKQNEST